MEKVVLFGLAFVMGLCVFDAALHSKKAEEKIVEVPAEVILEKPVEATTEQSK